MMAQTRSLTALCALIMTSGLPRANTARQLTPSGSDTRSAKPERVLGAKT